MLVDYLYLRHTTTESTQKVDKRTSNACGLMFTGKPKNYFQEHAGS